MFRNSSQELSQDAAGSRVLGAAVVPTTIAPSSSVESDERTPHPATRDDMDAMAATCRRRRIRLNTRTLLDLPCQGSAKHTAVFRPVDLRSQEHLLTSAVTTLSTA